MEILNILQCNHYKPSYSINNKLISKYQYGGSTIPWRNINAQSYNQSQNKSSENKLMSKIKSGVKNLAHKINTYGK